MAQMRIASGGYGGGALVRRQRELLDQQWPSGLPTGSAASFTEAPEVGFPNPWTLNAYPDKLTFNVFPGLTLTGLLFRPLHIPPVGGVHRDAWIICLSGHENMEMIRFKWFVDRGFNVIGLAMPHYQPNPMTWTYTRPNGTTELMDDGHAYEIIEGDDVPILPIFLNQIFMAANWIREQEGNTMIHLAGHSGGGWACALAAAADRYKSFTVKFANSGELPFYMRTFGDYEQVFSRPYFMGRDWVHLYGIAARFGKFIRNFAENENPTWNGDGLHNNFDLIEARVNAEIAAYPGEFHNHIESGSAHDFSETGRALFADYCLDYEPSKPPREPYNVALVANGATITASSSATNYPAEAVGNGLRHPNMGRGEGYVWQDNTGDTYPDWIEIDFGLVYELERIDVFTLADAADYNDDPTLTDTASIYNIVDFKIQQWDGDSWEDIPGCTVTGNNKVWRQFVLSPTVSTSKIRVYVTAGAGGFSRIVEVEAWSTQIPLNPLDHADIWGAWLPESLADDFEDEDDVSGATQWTDLSGNGRHAEPVGTGTITYKADHVNGQDALVFDGPYMEFPSMDEFEASGCYMIDILKVDDATHPQGGDAWKQGAPDYYPYGEGNLNLYFYRGAVDYQVFGGASELDVTEYHVLHGFTGPNHLSIYQNNELVFETETPGTLNFFADPQMCANGMKATRLGRYIFSTQPSEEDMARIWMFVQQKWGIAL